MTSTDNTASDENSESPESSPERSEIVRSVLNLLENEKQFHKIKELGKGTYGDVYLMYDPERKSTIAAKIVTSENMAETELAFWPKLQHRNIVPLIELYNVRSPDAAIFIMPVQKTNLNEMLYRKKFRRRHDSLDKVKQWLYEILCGLEYLHSKELCHLDLKVDNVLISHSSTAMLCDFTFLNTSVDPLCRYDIGLPYIYRPPEACKTLGADIRIEGQSYDSWGFGIMAVEIFTHFNMSNNLNTSKCWLRDIYPTMYEILQESRFTFLMSNTFLGVQLQKYQPRMALNFIHAFLKVDYTKRASILEATQHPFLQKGTIDGPMPDAIWKHKISKDMGNKVFNEMYIKIFDAYDQSICHDEDNSHVEAEEGHETDRKIDDNNYLVLNSVPEVKLDFFDESCSEIEPEDEVPNKIGYAEPSVISNLRSVTSYDAGDENSVDSTSEHNNNITKFKNYKNSIERLSIRKCEQNKYAVHDYSDGEESIDDSFDGDKIASSHSSFAKCIGEQHGSNKSVEDSFKLEITSANIDKIDTAFTASKGIHDPVQSQNSQSDSSKVFENMDNTIFCTKDFSRYLQIQENIIEGPIFENELFNERADALNDDPHFRDDHSKCSLDELSPDALTETKWERGDSMTSMHPLSKVAVSYEKPTPLESTNKHYDENEHHRNFVDIDISTTGPSNRQHQYRQLEPSLKTSIEHHPRSKNPDFCSDNDKTILDNGKDETVTSKGVKGRRQTVVKWMRHKCSGIERVVRRRWPYNTKRKQE